MYQTTLNEFISYTLKDGEYTFMEKLPEMIIEKEIWINPKLIIKKVKLRGRKGKYYIIGNILLRDDKEKVEKIQEMIFNAIKVRLKRKEKVERVKKVRMTNNEYVFVYNEERGIHLVDLPIEETVKFGGERIFFTMILSKDHASLPIDEFNKLFFKKVTSLYKNANS